MPAENGQPQKASPLVKHRRKSRSRGSSLSEQNPNTLAPMPGIVVSSTRQGSRSSTASSTVSNPRRNAAGANKRGSQPTKTRPHNLPAINTQDDDLGSSSSSSSGSSSADNDDGDSGATRTTRASKPKRKGKANPKSLSKDALIPSPPPQVRVSSAKPRFRLQTSARIRGNAAAGGDEWTTPDPLRAQSPFFNGDSSSAQRPDLDFSKLDSHTEFRMICDKLKEIFEEAKTINDGKQADYIPELAAVNPNLFAIAAVSCEGETFVLGDHAVPFTLQSTCKPLLYCLAQKLIGYDKVCALPPPLLFLSQTTQPTSQPCFAPSCPNTQTTRPVALRDISPSFL